MFGLESAALCWRNAGTSFLRGESASSFLAGKPSFRGVPTSRHEIRRTSAAHSELLISVPGRRNPLTPGTSVLCRPRRSSTPGLGLIGASSRVKQRRSEKSGASRPPRPCNVSGPVATPSSVGDQGIPLEPLRTRRGAVIVGGGPTGVAAALALAKLRGWSDVTIVEKSIDLTWADPDRSYVYSIDGRGMRCAQALGLDAAVRAAGVEVTDVDLTRVSADGKVATARLPVRDPTNATSWMPRSAFMKVLADGVEVYNQSCPSPERQIRVLTSSRVERIEKVGGSGDRLALVVTSEEEGSLKGKERVFYPSIVLGCDGINSIIRKTLHEWVQSDGSANRSGGDESSLKDSKGGGRIPKFGLNVYPSPAAGLRFKVLRLPPNPVTRAGVVLKNPTFAVLTGEYKGRGIRLGLLPVKDTTAGRTGNIITLPDHPFWQIPVGDVAAYRAALEEAFPQIDLVSLVSDDAMEAFASSEGGVFPAPQASDGVGYTLGGPGSTSSVLLLGDSAHAFPPDLGQGVNSALLDVLALTQHLGDCDDDLAAATRAYSCDRGPEADALAKLVAIGYPYQYQQAVWPARLFLAGFALRLGLSTLFRGSIVSPPGFFMVQDTRLRYGEILERADATTQRILLGGVAASAILLFVFAHALAG